jgi:hypothetical protein
MPARKGAKKVNKYSLELKRNAVRLTQARSCPDWIVANADGAGYYLARYDDALPARIAERFAQVPEEEAIAFARDAGLLARSGLLPLDAAAGALARVREPALRERMLGLTLDPRLDGGEAFFLLLDALEDEANRAPAFDFLRAHFDAVVAKLPPDSAARLATPLGDLCIAATGDRPLVPRSGTRD